MDPNKKIVIIIIISFILGSFVYLSIAALIFGSMIGLKTDEVMPWTAYEYFKEYSDVQKVTNALFISHGATFVLIVGFLVLLFKSKKLSLHGDAKWAKEKDLKNAEPKLRGTKGIILGKFNNKYIIQEGQQFALIAAPTRSGKGVSVVIPNCLNWTESLFVTDIKLENFKITSGFRHECGHKVFMFNPAPTDYKTHCWNPLYYINFKADFRVNDIQTIGNFLCPTPRAGDPMWTSEARELFLGVVLFLIDYEEYPLTIGEVLRQLRTEKESSEYFKDVLDFNRDLLDPICIRSLSGFVNLPGKQREGVKSTLTSALNLWSSPILDAATSENDFDFRDLRKKKITIYIGISPDNLKKFSPVLNLFIQQLINENIKEMPTEKEPYSVLGILDEFAALGSLQTVVDSVSFIAGYNLRLLPIIQTTAQLNDIYGKDKTINFIENHASRVLYAPKSIVEATQIANELGNTTVKSTSISGEMSMSNKPKNKTLSEAKRNLLLPQEVKEIGRNAQIVLSENCKPIRAEKITYYTDDAFLKRCIKPEFLKDVKKVKSQAEFLTMVKDPAPVPTINIIHYDIRGAKETEFDLVYNAISNGDIESMSNHNPDDNLTNEEIDDIANRFMTSLGG